MKHSIDLNIKYWGTCIEDNYLNIFLEFVPGGSISSLLAKFGPFNEAVIRAYTRQILLGLEYLHRHHIIHRDIKGANILVSQEGVVKLADFGASKRLSGRNFDEISLKFLRSRIYEWSYVTERNTILHGTRSDQTNWTWKVMKQISVSTNQHHFTDKLTYGALGAQYMRCSQANLLGMRCTIKYQQCLRL
jgi:serine/threonine protein kinase